MKTTQRQPAPASSEVRIVTDEVNVITLVLLVLFFAIKIALFMRLWQQLKQLAQDLREDMKRIAAGSMMVANQMADVKEKMIQAESRLQHMEARLDEHLLNCNGGNETAA